MTPDSAEIRNCKDPIQLFSRWLEIAKMNPNIREPTAMALGTASKDSEPSTRTVLFKGLAGPALTFYSNYHSRKGRDLEQNPKASLTFYWDALFRQIHFRGEVAKSTREQSEAYWRSRPRESQLSQTVSMQSTAVPKGVELEDLYAEANRKFADREIPCPDAWGGYILTPKEIEFWLGSKHRLHERFLFTQVASGNWSIAQLFP